MKPATLSSVGSVFGSAIVRLTLFLFFLRDSRGVIDDFHPLPVALRLDVEVASYDLGRGPRRGCGRHRGAARGRQGRRRAWREPPLAPADHDVAGHLVVLLR